MDEHFSFDPVNDDDDFNILALVEHSAHAILLARERELRQYGISSRLAAALIVIRALDNNATPTDISRWLLREPHTVTELLNRMDRDGYIHRYQDRQKKSVVRVAMTEKGREAYHDSLKRDSYHTIAACLTDAERDELRRILTKVWKTALDEVKSEGTWARMATNHLQSTSEATD
jgi:DNA-binding MarR family transcriptional regulator